MKRPDVIILGAGAAGLAAARVLSDAGRSALVLEARDRIGGRILTIRDPASPVPVELGAEFIHGRPEVTLDLLRESGQFAVDLPFDHRRRHAGRLTPVKDFAAELAKVMGGLPRLKHDVSFAQYLRDRRFPPKLRDACRFAVHFVEGFDAADPERISAKSLAEEQQGIGDVAGQMQFRPGGGYGALCEFLHRSLDPKRVRIELRTVATEIRWRRHEVEIQAAGPDGPALLRAPRVLVTLPIGILQLPPETAGSLRFTPDIPAKRDAANQLGSGPIVKVVLRFREPFWEDPAVARRARSDPNLRDAMFLHDSRAPFSTWWTSRPLRLPILTGWAGGPEALKLAGLSRSAIRRCAMESLSQLFGLRTGLSTPLERFHVHDWASDPFARGAYSYVTVGGSRARAALARPIDDTLFFGGEATDTSGQASTVAGHWPAAAARLRNCSTECKSLQIQAVSSHPPASMEPLGFAAVASEDRALEGSEPFCRKDLVR